MLTDIFAYRYQSVPIWTAVGESEKRLLTQCTRIVTEQLHPPYLNERPNPDTTERWRSIHDRLSMELGVNELASRYYSYQTQSAMGQSYPVSGLWSYDHVCKLFMEKPLEVGGDPDRHMKERISLVELAFREKRDEIAASNLLFPKQIAQAKVLDHTRNKWAGRTSDEAILRGANERLNESFRASAEELNERFRRSGCRLNYHNGFIQISEDPLVEQKIERPFWKLLDLPKWKNVDIDMKEAIDLRDAAGRDPAWYAARALESAIKIISDDLGATTGKENGPHNYIENLACERGKHFIDAFERDNLKDFFTEIRRPFGHGPGSADMPELSPAQTDWAIEFCMSWIKSLLARRP